MTPISSKLNNPSKSTNAQCCVDYQLLRPRGFFFFFFLLQSFEFPNYFGLVAGIVDTVLLL